MQVNLYPKWKGSVQSYSKKYYKITNEWLRQIQIEENLSIFIVHGIVNIILLMAYYLEPIGDALLSLDIDIYNIGYSDIQIQNIEQQNNMLMCDCMEMIKKLQIWSESFITKMASKSMVYKFLSILLNSQQASNITNILWFWKKTENENALHSSKSIFIDHNPHHIIFKLVQHWRIGIIHVSIFKFLKSMTNYRLDENTKNILIKDGIYHLILTEINILNEINYDLSESYRKYHFTMTKLIIQLISNLIINREQGQEEKVFIIDIISTLWTKNQQIYQHKKENKCILIFNFLIKLVLCFINNNENVWYLLRNIICTEDSDVIILISLLKNKQIQRIFLYITADDDNNNIIQKLIHFKMIDKLIDLYSDAIITHKKNYLLIINNLMYSKGDIIELFLKQNMMTFLFHNLQFDDQNIEIKRLILKILNSALWQNEIKVHECILRYNDGAFIKQICKSLRQFNHMQDDYTTIIPEMNGIYAITEYMQTNINEDYMIQCVLTQFETEDIGDILQNTLLFINKKGLIDERYMTQMQMNLFIESLQYLINFENLFI